MFTFLRRLRRCSSSTARAIALAIVQYLSCPVSSTAQTHAGNALLFNPCEGDVVVVPHSPAISFPDGSSATFEAWLMLTSDPGIFHVFGKRVSCWGLPNEANYQMARDAGGFGFGSGVCGPPAIETPGVNQWFHVAVTFEAGAGSARMYLNGSLVSEASSCSTGGENTVALVIGNSDGCGGWFPGLIDEVRFWNVARTADQIAAYYTCSFVGPTPGLVACWNFDESFFDQNVVDCSGFGNLGTLGVDLNSSGEDPLRVPSTAPISCIATDAPASPPQSPDATIGFFIEAPRPHPVGNGSSIPFSLLESGQIDLSVFDVRGARMGTITRRFYGAGRNEVAWPHDLRLRPGTYFLRLSQDEQAAARKVVIVR